MGLTGGTGWRRKSAQKAPRGYDLDDNTSRNAKEREIGCYKPKAGFQKILTGGLSVVRVVYS